jgi:hypothetical protein
MQMANTYFVHTSLGWGRGDDPATAVANYYKAQRNNFPHLADEEIEQAWGFVWRAPEGADGFYHGVEGMYWTGEGDDELATLDQRVLNVGNVPERFRL